MRNLIIGILLLSVSTLLAQTNPENTKLKTGLFKHIDRKGKIYLYWGWNRAQYTNSDIHFKGGGYDFTLYDVKAYDRQEALDWVYINPATITIPQYQYRVGYYINDHYNISAGWNHMKYVMRNGLTSKISGHIGTPEAGKYNGDYKNDDIVLDADFLQFEHTDGLNYLSFNFDRIDAFWVSKNKKFNANIIEGVGAGIMYPKSNVRLFSERQDKWHIAGYGMSAHIAIRVDIFTHFFIQGQLEGGYINMPDILTTIKPGARADQHLWYFERMIMFGGYVSLFSKKA